MTVGKPTTQEQEYQRVWQRLYTLACYAYGGSGPAQESLLAGLRVLFPAQGGMDPEKLLLCGIRFLYEWRRVSWCSRGVSYENPQSDPAVGVLAELSFEERFTALLFARHGMSAQRIAGVLGIEKESVRRMLASAGGRFQAVGVE